MYLFVFIVIVLLDPQDVFVAKSSMFSSATLQPGRPDPSNANLDPNDQSPGSIVLPKHYKRYSAPLPKIEPWDLTDDQINVHDYHYRNKSKYFLWENPPCEYYREKLESTKNHNRGVGCYHIAKRLQRNQWKEDWKNQPRSQNCSHVTWYSRCFEFRSHKARCYMMIQTSFYPDPRTFKYVLVNYCD